MGLTTLHTRAGSHSEDGGTVSGASWVVPPTECDYGGRLVDAIPGTAPHDILDHPVWASCNAGRGLKDSRCSIALAVDRICRPVLVATFLDYAKFPISKDNRGCAVQAQGGKRRIVVGKDRCVKQCPPFIMERSLAYVIMTSPASLGTTEHTLPTTYVQSATSAIFCYGSRKTTTSPHRSPAQNEHQECDFRAHVIMDDKGSLMRVPSLVPTIRFESSDDWYLPLPPSTVLYEQYPPPPPLRVSSKSEEQYPPLPRYPAALAATVSAFTRSSSASTVSSLSFSTRSSSRTSSRPRPFRVQMNLRTSRRRLHVQFSSPSSVTVSAPSPIESHGAPSTTYELSSMDETSLTSSSNLMAFSRALSSVRMSTIPRSVASLMAPSERAPSSSSLSEVPMQAGFGFWSESSSLGRTLSVLTQSSFLSDSTAPSPSPSPPPLPESPSTHSPSSPGPSRPPSPSSLSLRTHEASGSVSISIPRGDVPSVRSLLDTVPSYRRHTASRVRRGSLFADELRRLADVRGEETQDIVRALRNELRDLADFLHRPTSHPTSPVQVLSPTPIPHAPPPVDRTPSPVAAPERVIQLLEPPPMNYTSSLLFRTSSNASSYLSSHHSDDGLWSPFPDSLYPGEPCVLSEEPESSPDYSPSSGYRHSPSTHLRELRIH
ncbi:hypothetical protein C8F04DRAFT_1327379 [Mycena alexandri]|uniref:Uncharacterized protein n=1 Tax=Mycena alexandri TaxID=1745969 RepID=A0AAD6S418_9AGAR|nr:hypothetical protein C8F04DRAFT_1327379 [Mycena alexandri]